MIPANFVESTAGPSNIDHQNPATKILVQGTEISGCIVDSGFGVNVISKATCSCLGITTWEVCPFWLRMADTRSVQPIELLQKLSIIIGGHMFEISAIVLALEAPGAYPLLLGRQWLCSANIKQNWQHNHISFPQGRAKIRVSM